MNQPHLDAQTYIETEESPAADFNHISFTALCINCYLEG